MTTDEQIVTAVRAIHGSRLQFALVMTAGVAAADWLLAEPGASSAITEVCVPYSNTAFDRYIGATPTSYVSTTTARKLVRCAYLRAAQERRGANRAACGVSCTAALKTNRKLAGDERLFVGWHTEQDGGVLSLRFAADRTRREQSQIAGLLILQTMLRAASLKTIIELNLKDDERTVESPRDTA